MTSDCYLLYKETHNTNNKHKQSHYLSLVEKEKVMENHQRSPLLGWAYYFQGKGVEELRNSLVYTSVELENTKMAVQEEVRKRDDQLVHLKDLLNKALRERDEAQEKCQRLLMEKLLLQQQNGPLSGISSIEDEPRRGIDFSSSDCEESIVSSPVIDPIPTQLPQQGTELPLPEKGKLLQAVMKAGPLLQTLLLAGPLPEWRHPPPPLDSFQIPPVTISSHPSHIDTNCGRKRVLCETSDSPAAPPETKFQRVLLH